MRWQLRSLRVGGKGLLFDSRRAARRRNHAVYYLSPLSISIITLQYSTGLGLAEPVKKDAKLHD
eukprot:scaffold12565_cov35-Tisochrysis_lutea.AAC.4